MPKGSEELTKERENEIIDAFIEQRALRRLPSRKSEKPHRLQELRSIIIFRRKRRFFLLCYRGNMSTGTLT